MATPSPNLALQRCFNHAGREAAARCPECRQYFCRECVTEHDDRVLCTTCLKNLTKRGLAKRSAFSTVSRVVQCVVGLFVAWFFFFLIGEGLIRLPAAFHATDLWQVPWIDSQ